MTQRIFRAAPWAAALAAGILCAQPPGRAGGRGAGRSEGGGDAAVNKLMAFDANQDGKLTKEELADPRLHALFDRADANKDGVVTREELTALFKAEESQAGARGGGGPGGGKMGKNARGKAGKGFGGPPPGGEPPEGGPGGDGPGGPGGFGGGPPKPGTILPHFIQDELDLTPQQKRQLAALQKQVDERLDKILTPAQKEKLADFRPGPPPGGGDDGPPDRPPGDGGGKNRGKKGPPPDGDGPPRSR